MKNHENFRTSEQANSEKGYLVGVHIKRSRPLLNIDDSLAELSLLATTAGVEVVGQTYQQLSKPHSATFIGPGKVDEIREDLAALHVDVIVFDDELSPRHQRELEKSFGEEIKVLDRSALILDIFARHAQTHEGALQVELAQYEYRLPRLTRQWTHLARQAGGGAARAGAGGVGLRGPGETQLEVDRREISRRISRLKKEIEGVRSHRSRHRQQRRQSGIPVIAFVGYTNAGKSTLLNALTQADVYTADQLFATLDTTTRRVKLPGGQVALCSDTVGFIQKLPTTLIAAFRATLEEIAEADLIVHVADANHPNVLEQIEAVEDTLAVLDLPDIPRLLALNKIDLLGDNHEFSDFNDYEAVIPISAAHEIALDTLLEHIETILSLEMQHIQLLIPYQRGDLVAKIHDQGQVINENHTPDGVIIEASIKQALAAQLLTVNSILDVSDNFVNPKRGHDAENR
ncbi:GTPase HflX [Chloroflexota bacterium]